ncbi:MAG: hypothetical protein ABIQ93_13710 [Saprospiraceae bacterium]
MKINMLGNILLVSAVLTLFGLLFITASPSPSGDYGVGYAFLLFSCGAGFLLTSGLLAWNLTATGRFDWLPALGGNRNWLIFFGWLAFAVATLAMSLFRSEWHAGELPEYLHGLSKTLAGLWLPLLVLVPALLLINMERTTGTVADFVKFPLLAGVAMGFFIALTIVFGLLRAKAMETMDKREYAAAHAGELDSFQQGMLAEIDSCDISKDMVFMLVHTDAQRNPIIRERALAKIKTRPDWQEELVRRLDSGGAEDAFIFLASNEVTDKSLFPEAVRKGVLSQAEIVRKTIKESRSLYADQYGWEVERVLRTVEKFAGMGVDYLPAVRELRAAFDQSSPFDKPDFRAAPYIDKWIKKRQ